jgi:glycolate oxidase FAD binding subunit
MSETITIDGVGPMPVERPASVAELRTIVRRCADTKTAIYPVGGGTMLDYGMPPARTGIALSTAALNQVIDYPARDLTITVEAGVTMQTLQDTLAAENQWLPIDVPNPERATIGGAIACDVSGPRRYGYGTLRDYVIGITVVNDRGEETHAGGRVVKNVAGYDMMKLHTGALGTLGVITQVTLKVRPRPEAWESRVFCFEGDRIGNLLAVLRSTAARPSILSFRGYSHNVAPADNFWSGVIVFEGNKEAVTWQVQQVIRELRGLEIDADTGASGTGASPHIRVERTDAFVFRTIASADHTPAICEVAIRTEGVRIWGQAAGEILEISHGDDEWGDPGAPRFFDKLVEMSFRSMGNVVLLRCPIEFKRVRCIWGRPPPDLSLQKAVKRALDPQNLFNPGRFVTDCF